MRVLVDRGVVHTWSTAGVATVGPQGLRWASPLGSGSQPASPARADEVWVPPAVRDALVAAGDVVDAQALDEGGLVAVRRGDAGLELVVVDATTLQVELLAVLDAEGRPSDAFAGGADRGEEDDEAADVDDAHGDDAAASSSSAFSEGTFPRSVRVVARGDRVGIGAAGSGHAAIYDRTARRFETVLRLSTGPFEVLTATPIDGGVLLACQFNSRWLELAVVTLGGETVARWPPADEAGDTYGVPECAVVGEAVVVCADAPTPTAYLLSLPALEPLDAVEIPESRVDVAARDAEVHLLGMAHLVAVRVEAGRLALEEPSRWIEVNVRDESPPANPVGAGFSLEVEEIRGRLEAAHPGEPTALVFVDGRVAAIPPGHALAAPPRPGARRVLHLAGSAVLSCERCDGGWRVRRFDVATGEDVSMVSEAQVSWGRLLGDTVLLGLTTFEGFDERCAVTSWRVGEPLATRLALPRQVARVASDREHLVLTVDDEEGECSWCWVPADPRAPVPGLQPLTEPPRALAVCGDRVVAIVGDHEGRLVRLDRSGRIVHRSDVVTEWTGSVLELAVNDREAAWVASRPGGSTTSLHVASLDEPAARPREGLVSSFGELSCLTWHDGAWWCIESNGSRADLGNADVIVPRSRILRLRG